MLVWVTNDMLMLEAELCRFLGCHVNYSHDSVPLKRKASRLEIERSWTHGVIERSRHMI